MENGDLTRSYLETLSSTDLIDVADDYGIDIPENLTRRFVIAEILEAIVDAMEPKKSEIKETKIETEIVEIPLSYNENKITPILRNPAWCYVYWDFKKDDFQNIVQKTLFESFALSVSYYDDIKAPKAFDVVDISIDTIMRELFILLSTEAVAFRIELIARFTSGDPYYFATSKFIALPRGYPDISLSSLQQDFSTIQNLSGLPELMKMQYSEHRQSFLREQ